MGAGGGGGDLRKLSLRRRDSLIGPCLRLRDRVRFPRQLPCANLTQARHHLQLALPLVKILAQFRHPRLHGPFGCLHGSYELPFHLAVTFLAVTFPAVTFPAAPAPAAAAAARPAAGVLSGHQLVSKHLN